MLGMYEPIMLITTAVTIKLLGLVATSASAFGILATTPEAKVKRNLRRVFKSGELGIKRVSKKGKEFWNYPNIKSAEVTDDRAKLSFLLPKGFDPAKVVSKEWIFNQHFGPYIALEGKGDKREFLLTAYKSDLPKSYKYDFEVVKKQSSKCTVPIYVGLNYDGHFVYDMRIYPMLLITGETGSGKSYCLRSIVTSLIQSIPPEKLELYCADLKLSEFHVFQNVAHEVVYEDTDLERILTYAYYQLLNRGKLTREYEVESVYDLKNPPPTIVICIDEVALVKGVRSIMSLVERIGATGRALGIFLILSMQRADREVLNGRLKQCLTVRISFRQPDEINSRIAVGDAAASHIPLNCKGRLVIRHVSLEMMQAPLLDLKVAKELLSPFKVVRPTKINTMPLPASIDIEGYTVDEEEPDQFGEWEDD